MVTKCPEINMCYACGAMIGVRAWCDHYLIPNVTCFDVRDAAWTDKYRVSK